MAKVLIVDDEPDIELLAKQKFRKQTSNGTFELLFAQNGQEALDLIKQDPDIAVVVSDVNMPQMDGFTLIDKLRESNPHIRTIIVSAYGDTKTWRSAMNKGVFDFVTKPVDFKELGEAIQNTLAQYKPPSSPLYTYQLMLANAFPKGVTLNYPHSAKTLLWDAFSLNTSHILFLGISVVPSQNPFELEMGAVHGLLKSALFESPNLSLTAINEKIRKFNPSLHVHVLIGIYHQDSHTFSYQTNGEFEVEHIALKKKLSLAASETALLVLGDVITLKSTNSISHLSLAEIHEN